MNGLEVEKCSFLSVCLATNTEAGGGRKAAHSKDKTHGAIEIFPLKRAELLQHGPPFTRFKEVSLDAEFSPFFIAGYY